MRVQRQSVPLTCTHSSRNENTSSNGVRHRRTLRRPGRRRPMQQTTALPRATPRCLHQPAAAAAAAAFHQRRRRLRHSCRAFSPEQPPPLREPACLGTLPSQFNQEVAVWQFPEASRQLPQTLWGARALLLSASGNIHSVICPGGRPLTGQYWDCLALLPALVPAGPLLILGLGAGTIAQLVHALYPHRAMEGYELDPAVVQLARQHMDLQQLEQQGCLLVRVGDALAADAAVQGGAAGIFVDLFAEDALLPQLTQVDTWASIRARLAPGGRVIANLGAALDTGSMSKQLPGASATRAALAAMQQAFDGQLSCCNLVHGACANMIAVTGAPPVTSDTWAAAGVPADLQVFAHKVWEPCTAYVL